MSNDTGSKNIFFNTLLTVCQFVFPLITFPYLARILMPEGLGVVNFLDNIIQYLIFIVGIGIPIYGVREIARAKNDLVKRGVIFNELLFINIFSAIIILLIYITVLFFLQDRIASLHLYLLAGIVVFLNIFNVEWLFQGLEEFSYITKRSIIVKSIAILLTFSLVRDPGDILYYYFIMILSYLINAAVNLSYARRKFGFGISLKIKSNNLKQHIKPIFLIFSANLAISLFLYFDSFILGILSGTKAVGLYMTAIKLVKIPVLFIVAYINALVPKIAFAVKEHNFDQVDLLVQKSFNYALFLSVPVGVGMFIAADFIIYLFAGANYMESVLPLKIMCAAIVPLALTNIFVWQILTPFSKEKYFMKTVVAGMIVSLTLNLLLIPRISHVGTAISTLVTEIVICLLSFFFAQKVYKLKLDYWKAFQSLLSCIPMLLLYFTIHEYVKDFIWSNILIIICSIVSYFTLQVFYFKNNIFRDFRFTK